MNLIETFIEKAKKEKKKIVFPEGNDERIITAARAYGPILQGFKKPVCDLSRGATSNDVVGITAIVAVQAITNESR